MTPSPTAGIAAEIETLIRARYPILYLVTSEELRAEEIVGEVAQRRQKGEVNFGVGMSGKSQIRQHAVRGGCGGVTAAGQTKEE